MSSLFAALMSPLKTVQSIFSPTAAAREANPLKTPPENYRPETPSGKVLTPKDRKNRRVSFNKNMAVPGTTGFERCELPGEKRREKVKPKAKPAAKAKPAKKAVVKKEPKAAAKKVSPKKTPPKKKGTPVKVKTEATRASRRSRGYKKGMYSQSRLENIAWNGGGTVSDPIVFV
ncbi:hypothetical protein TeGR_g2473 [Tetraparma gracilis]|uniref:Uncharacterized protein n=1 Tax=Tetraparma gracilis TaxID=2962635 RepID=A0ABQ6MZM6_9STRA|nr:hypothetical protein TeGR_g2473 [Tetraparma gracilis]